MPTLHWIGKDKVINHHREVPFKILEHKYHFSPQTPEEEHIGDGNEPRPNRFSKPVRSNNKIIHGDNLEALKALLPEYEGRIKCIYIDPPYNTGNESWVYNDNVNDPKILKWLGQVVGKEAEDLTRHDKWLCMMYPRLKLLHKLLAKDGVIFISIDDNEQANLKLICDEIYGSGNYIGRFIWKKKKQPSFLAKHIAYVTEVILVFSKNAAKVKKLSIEDVSDDTRRIDNAANEVSIRRISKGINVRQKVNIIPKGVYKIKTMELEFLDDVFIKEGRTVNDFEVKGQFRNKQEDINNFCKDDLLFITTNGGFRRLPTEAEKEKKKTVVDLLTDWGDNQDSDKELSNIFDKKPFDYPKPSNLILNLIKSVTYDSPTAIILDSFAGSGTTAHAVLNLNKQDGGNRKFILVEMEEYAETITSERVKRVMKKMSESEFSELKNEQNFLNSENRINSENFGLAFDFYELGKPLFVGENSEYLNEEVELEKIHEYIWYSETKTPFVKHKNNDTNPYYLGKKEGLALYFIYEKEYMTELNYDMLATIKTKADQFIIYADSCLLPKEFMLKNNIVFKKIPRDITRF